MTINPNAATPPQEGGKWWVSIASTWSRRGGAKWAYVFNKTGYWPIPGHYSFKSAEAAQAAGERALVEGGWNEPHCTSVIHNEVSCLAADVSRESWCAACQEVYG